MRPKPLSGITQLKVRHLIFCFLLGIGLSSTVFAQQACFTIVDSVTKLEADSFGCAPFRVHVKNCYNGLVSYNYNYQGGFNPLEFIADTIHTYGVGSYTIAQFANAGVPLALRRIRVFDPQTRPSFTWKTCGSKLLIHFIDSVFFKYSFDPGNGSANVIFDGKDAVYDYGSPLGSPFTFSILGIRPSTCNQDLISDKVSIYPSQNAPVPIELKANGTDTLQYSVRLGVRADEDFGFQLAPSGVDFSGLISPGRENEDNADFSISLPALQGNGLQGGRLRGITRKYCGSGADTLVPAPEWTIFWPIPEPENQKITLKWPALNIIGLSKFEILRNGQLLASPPISDGLYVDQNNLVCGLSYSYQFRTEVLLPGGGMMVFVSPVVEAKAISNRPPDPVDKLNATVTAGSILISGTASPLASIYHLFRRERDVPEYAEIGNGFSSLPIQDSSALISSKAYCYKIAFDDICGNRSRLSDSICPVLLKYTNQGGVYEFDWTSMSGWKGGVLRYELIRTVPGQAGRLRYSGLDLEHAIESQDTIAKRVFYRIHSLPTNSGFYPEGSWSNEVEVIQETRLRFPDTFTPNEDGINDFFQCYGLFLKSFELVVYNSWGNIVFSSNKLGEFWNGKIDGLPAPTGNYAYRAIATDESGERLEKSGFFALIR